MTGAAGFIGFHLSQRLLDDKSSNHIVVGLDNLNDYYDVTLKQARLNQLKTRSNFSFVQVDLSDRAAMAQLFATSAFDIVINLASQAGVRHSTIDPYAYLSANVLGFLNILEGCRHHVVEAISRLLHRSPPSNAHLIGTTFESDHSSAPYRLYNVGNQSPVELTHLIEVLEATLGMPARKNMLPMQPGDVAETFADVSDLMNDIGFQLKTTLQEGIAKFVAWYRDYHRV